MGDSRIVVRMADWLDWAQSLSMKCVDFLYADPPFNTGREQVSPPNGTSAVISADRSRETGLSYADRFGSAQDFIAWLRPRLAATIPALKPTALVALHVDWRTSHHVRLLLDELLGADRFVNHLIWSYGLGGSSPRRFARKHDDILLYCVDPDRYYFDPPRVPATSRRLAGQSKKATDVLDMPPVEEPGIHVAAGVLDVPSLNNMARERTGYPTQKPLALLELLIGACCPPDGLVVDPCCGSGTTLVAAQRLGRRAAGCDVNPDAVRIARARLEQTATGHQPAAGTTARTGGTIP